jgi:hypothetical protein
VKGDKIRYKKNYKYVLEDDATCMTGICPPKSLVWKWGILSENGAATIYRNYPWDGPSGPMPDIRSAMRPSLWHDWFYEMLRLTLLPLSFKPQIDDLLHNMCVEDGMHHVLAELVEETVENFGASSADPAAQHEILEAP